MRTRQRNEGRYDPNVDHSLPIDEHEKKTLNLRTTRGKERGGKGEGVLRWRRRGFQNGVFCRALKEGTCGE